MNRLREIVHASVMMFVLGISAMLSASLPLAAGDLPMASKDGGETPRSGT